MSIDQKFRMEGESWWPQEIPSTRGLNRGLRTLEASALPPDFVLTHTCPSDVFRQMLAAGAMESGDLKIKDPTIPMLDRLQTSLKKPPSGWYFGHFHVDFDWGIYKCLNERLVVV